jgi:lauroyl/myristoyl acyltransferase
VSAKDRTVDWAYAAGWRVIRALPEAVAARLFRAVADEAVRRDGRGVRQLAENLRVVVGPDLPDADFDLLVRDAMRSYARYWLEAFRLPSLTQQDRLDKFGFDRTDVLLANAVPGSGVILALAHWGNWDAAGAYVTANGMALTTVAERLKPEALYERFVAFRAKLGMEIVPLTGGDRATLDLLADRLKAGAVVPLLADRDLSARGVEVTFFGRRTKMPPGPAILALRTGAPLYVVTCWFEPDRPVGSLSHRIELTDTSGSFGDRARRLTQLLANEFERGIRKHPTDWHMLARMFLDEPAGVPAARSDTPGSRWDAPAAVSDPSGTRSDSSEAPAAVESGPG